MGLNKGNELIGFDGAERVVLGRRGLLGEEVEERGFADVGETNDAHFEGIFGAAKADHIGGFGGGGLLGRHGEDMWGRGGVLER